MGYRSDVRSIIYGPKETLDAFLTMQSLIIGSEALRVFRKNLTRTSAIISVQNTESSLYEDVVVNILLMSGDSWKWYEGYEDVDAWINLLKQAHEFGLSTEFLRVGEDITDIEQHNSGDSSFFLYVTVEIGENFDRFEDLPLGI